MIAPRFSLVLACTLAAVAGAQTPPKPPRKPATPPRIEKPVEPPRVWNLDGPDFDRAFDKWRFDELNAGLEQLRLAEPMWHDNLNMALKDAEHALRDLPHELTMAHEVWDNLPAQLDMAGHAFDMVPHDFPDVKFELDRMQGAIDKAARGFDGWPEPPGIRDGFRNASGKSRDISSTMRAPWAQGDPADSLYKLAREALNRGEYRRAAQLCREIPTRYPQSAYAADALYYQAYSLYKIGGMDDLKEAQKALELQRSKYKAESNAKLDADALDSRINGALAQRGDRDARQRLTNAANESNQSCDREDQAVRLEALNALSQSDPDAATPIIKKVLARRDACSSNLRRQALFLLGRRADSASADLLVDAARNDTDIDVRVTAIEWLSRIPGDRSLAVLEDILKTSNDERMQRSAVRALSSHQNPKARTAIRSLIERQDVPVNLRIEALNSFDRERSTADDATWLRNLYPKLDNDRLKERVLTAVARIGGNENDQWLAGVLRRSDESIDLRASALRSLGQRSMAIGDLVKMYDTVGELRLRQQLIDLYGMRKEPEATDKLIEIARSGTDAQLRRYSIQVLSRKNDPRTTQLLIELINK